MRKSQEGRALRQFTLSTGKSAGRNSSGRITRGGGSGNWSVPILIGVIFLLFNAGAALSLNYPYFLSPALVSVIYYILLYISIYIDMKCSLYDRTIAILTNFIVKERVIPTLKYSLILCLLHLYIRCILMLFNLIQLMPFDFLIDSIGYQPLDFVSFSACDGVVGAEGPPSPPVVQIPEAPLEAPELHPAPPVIPVLDQPLLPEIQRQDELYRRFLVNTIGEFPTLDRISETIRVQSLVERHVEAALVHQGFPPESILMNRHLIRGLVFYFCGRALSPRTYRSYLEEIERLGTRDTRAFQRILRAIQNSELFL